VRGFCAFACAAGYARVDPARLVRRARCPAPQPQGLTEAEAERLIAVLATAGTEAERRDQALFVTMLKTGIRLGTAVALDVRDLDLDAGELHLRVLKNGGRDVVFVPKDIFGLLREHVHGRVEGALFPAADGERLGARQVHRRLAEWARRAGIEKPVHPHTLRHAFAQRLFRATSNVLLVARALCHRSVASTQVYVRPDDAMVRRALGA
jgi:site-specific recombinase XerC